METNALAELITTLRTLAIPQPAGMHPLVQMTVLVLASLSPLIASVAAFWAKKAMHNTEMAKVATELNKEATVVAAKAAIQMAASVENIHVAVNSERSNTLAEIKKLRDEMLEMTRQRSLMEERLREYEHRDARREDVRAATASAKAQIAPPDPVATEHSLIKKLTQLLEGYEAPLPVAK